MEIDGVGRKGEGVSEAFLKDPTYLASPLPLWLSWNGYVTYLV